MFVDTSMRQGVKDLRWWWRQCLGFSLSRTVRFLPVSPPFLAKQIIYDRRNNKILLMEIRDAIDWQVIWQIFYNEEYGLEKLSRCGEIEQHYTGLVSRGLVPVIIDCGANIGAATRYFAETFPEAHIYCVEPERNNMNLARANNSSGNITFLEVAVGSSDSRGEIVDAGWGNWGFRVHEDAKGSITIMSIESVLNTCVQGNSKPFIAKIDIEGFENDLLSANTEWIDKFPVIVIELHDWMLPKTANSRNFLREISKRDRDFVIVGENIFSLSNEIL